MLGAFGNLKESANRPGPGAYNLPSSIQQGGGPFGKAKRTLTVDASASAAYATAIGKERAFLQSRLPEEDELDAFVSQQAVRSPPSAGYLFEDLIDPPPRAMAVPRPQPMSHAAYLRSLDTTPRLLHGNIFPYASYVNSNRHSYNKQSFESQRYAHPWREQTNHDPVKRRHFHMPNEFSEHIAGAARMGLKPFGSSKP